MEKFRIVDIEKTPQVRGIQQLESKEGEDNSPEKWKSAVSKSMPLPPPVRIQ
jgi:hypothetical protein